METHIILYIAGGAAFLIGMMFRSWAGRHDLIGVLWDSVWQLVRGKRRGGQKTDIEDRFAEITSAATTVGKLRRASGSVIGHLLSATVGLIGLVLVLGGLVAVATGFYLH